VLGRLRYFGRETTSSLSRNFGMTVAGILTVFVSLFLFGGSLLLQRFVDHGVSKWRGGVELEIFLRRDAPQSDIDAVRIQLDKFRQQQPAQVRRYEYLDHQAAYDRFKQLFSENNPQLVKFTTPDVLPTSYLVVPTDAQYTEDLRAAFDGAPSVLDVVTPGSAVDRLLKVVRVIRWVFFSIAAVLLASSLFLIVNTIRLAIFARRREIQVMKLVGATNWFIRIPFMLEGLIEGAVGALLAFGGVGILKWALSNWVQGSNLFSATSFFLTTGDAVTIGIFVVVIGAVVGAVGSAIGLRRFLEV
jgi:cell division transport system permease protein